MRSRRATDFPRSVWSGSIPPAGSSALPGIVGKFGVPPGVTRAEVPASSATFAGASSPGMGIPGRPTPIGSGAGAPTCWMIVVEPSTRVPRMEGRRARAVLSSSRRIGSLETGCWKLNAGPGRPGNPRRPAGPAGPRRPVAPIGPAGPTAPVAPVGPGSNRGRSDAMISSFSATHVGCPATNWEPGSSVQGVGSGGGGVLNSRSSSRNSRRSPESCAIAVAPETVELPQITSSVPARSAMSAETFPMRKRRKLISEMGVAGTQTP